MNARNRTFVTGFAWLIALCVPQPARAGPLDPLYPLQARINQSMRLALRGQPYHEHYYISTWAPSGPVLAQVKALGVTRVVMLSMRFDVFLLSENRGVLRHLHTMVRPTRAGPRLLRLVSQPHNEAARDWLHWTACGRRMTKPFCKAAKALVRTVTSRRCVRLRFARSESLDFLPRGTLAEGVKRRLQRSRSNLPAVCAELGKFRHHDIRVHTGEVRFAAFGADRKLRGVIEAELRFSKDFPWIRLLHFTPAH